MKMKPKRLYEGMYIINASLSEEAIKKTLERITNPIVEGGGKVESTIDMGRKKLAYQINGHKQGHYYLLFFSAPSNTVAEMWREYQLNEDLIRFMTLSSEEILESLEFKPLQET